MIINKFAFWITVFSVLLLMGCSKSNDQRDFENRALTTPDKITKTDSNGEIVGQTDPDDWRVGPMYNRLISISSELSDPPHPNPLPYNSTLNLQIEFNVSDPVNVIVIRKFRLPTDTQFPLLRQLDQSELIDFNSIALEGSNIAENTTKEGLYRILIYDGKQNLISYGDVRIE
ncbi:hypothetical protein LX73_0133 [Fodinibius salinus]|uniref:Lipoprotein n=1 Tax=Fodinibius salinus TaxID=860790 RepID=A0A5D3YLM2_9BACT|nr:hypothetical protein [Fodinibius salinus]TYP94844.1 hypothetical protein LX73_0133 [Fodinibius salinus]